ncbi:glycosyltransferase family 2 protein [Patescibacteria group bacterium]|nr:glycosyltransferase family 2 protein [Patescibacteria group bacterium]MBU1473186.1 glycosyltransferase family 2 protein [Patescibacteria group bacterium]MBU2459764.1 glycosyltransferase family 2 protein [Patescibacteria group bacterium]MBU2544276.1 glycosyltransferase family 2 protein [Patescibacteria group bacterium]
MGLSIIIVSYNTKKLLGACLDSVKKSLKGADFDWEVIVVDNVSHDGTREMIAEKYPWVRTILNKENVGFGRANNQGMREAKGDVLFLLNSDTVILDNAISKLLSFQKKHPTSFVGPKLFNVDRSPQTSCGAFFRLPVVFASLFLKGDYNGLVRWSPNKIKKVDWVSGAAFMGPKKLFFDDLLFDEKIFMYMEEIDLLYRACKKGYDTFFYPNSKIIHIGGGSSPTRRKEPVLHIYRGYQYFYAKHYGNQKLTILKFLLKVKAAAGWTIGAFSGNEYLRTTYAEAFRLV